MFMDWNTHIVNMSLLFKFIHKFNAIPTKITTKLLVDIDKIIIRWNGKTKELK